MYKFAKFSLHFDELYKDKKNIYEFIIADKQFAALQFLFYIICAFIFKGKL